MSKVKVLAAIEFAIGTVRLVTFEGLGDATINVNELPGMTFEVTQLDTGLQHRLHLQLDGNGSVRQSFDEMQLQELVQAKLVEMLRLEDVVKLYGNLKLEAPAPEPYSSEFGMQHHNRPHPLEWAAREVVQRLLSGDHGESWHAYHRSISEIQHLSDGSWKLSLKLDHGLQLEGGTKADMRETSHRHRGRGFGSLAMARNDEDYRIKGTMALGDEKFYFTITHDEFPIAKHLVFTEVAHTVALKLAAEFPFLKIDAKSFTKTIVAA